MERFKLDTWLQDKSRKIVTRDGKPVRIICYNVKQGKQEVHYAPIIALVDKGEENGEMSYYYTEDGRFLLNSNLTHNLDLFFADIDTYNPYKVVVKSIAEMVERYELYHKFYIDSNLSDFLNNVKIKCKDAMEYDELLPQEEFIPKKQYDEDLDKAYKNTDIVQFNRGMSEILNNPKKYFHVGDTIRLKNSNAEYTITSIYNGRYYGEGWSLDIIKAADIYELVEDYDEKK